MKRIIREFYEQQYANKLDYVHKMDKYLETHKLLKLSQEEIENLNRSITRKGIELVIKTFSQREAQDHMASLVITTKHLKKS